MKEYVKNGQMMTKGTRIYYGDIRIIDLNLFLPCFNLLELEVYYLL